MATLDHHGMGHPDHGRSVPPEYALLLFLLIAGLGLALAWPWVW